MNHTVHIHVRSSKYCIGTSSYLIWNCNETFNTQWIFHLHSQIARLLPYVWSRNNTVEYFISLFAPILWRTYSCPSVCDPQLSEAEELPSDAHLWSRLVSSGISSIGDNQWKNLFASNQKKISIIPNKSCPTERVLHIRPQEFRGGS